MKVKPSVKKICDNCKVIRRRGVVRVMDQQRPACGGANGAGAGHRVAHQSIDQGGFTGTVTTNHANNSAFGHHKGEVVN